MPTRCTEAATCSGIRNSGPRPYTCRQTGEAGSYVWAAAGPVETVPIVKIAKARMRIRASFGIHSKISCTPRLLAKTFVVAAVDDELRRAADDPISRRVIFCSRITDRLPMFGIGANAKAGCHVFREKSLRARCIAREGWRRRSPLNSVLIPTHAIA